ncbi:uncharacterized protein LOC141619772 [Silene latifolia]|uniref:uncharacterized protein LOC141619772 n=1 Tax=Silene latifolia TaxID=37657 RepID=UPI003D776A19
MDVVKNLQGIVPFTELVTQVPAYVKFLRKILSKKRSFDEVESVAFTHECYAALQANSPPKFKDPESFSIPCTIGRLTIDSALCDLGASVTVMSSIKHPMGILEDVPVKIGKFFIPVDFVVIDIAEDSCIPIILGRPFLHTTGEVIDVRHGSLMFNIGDGTITFGLDKASRPPNLKASCHMINALDPSFDECLALYFDRNPPNTPAAASYPWSKEVDEIKKLIYGDDPPPKMV